MLNITEGPNNDITTVLAFLEVPIEVTEKPEGAGTYWKPYTITVESFSDFNNDFKYHDARNFIATLDASNPGKYSNYRISYTSCN